ncbi:MAG: hypothetical protein HYZ53_26415 [Planctomycetes bacterium]|nr:hypothetical protein [Planctomycetota bacterium]
MKGTEMTTPPRGGGSPPTSPFRDRVVDKPWDDTVDVEAIHAEATEQILSVFDEVTRSIKSRSFLLLAPAGEGKTHLLSRIRRRIADRGSFIFVPPYFEAATLPHFVLRLVIEGLGQPVAGRSYTQLHAFLAHAFSAALVDILERPEFRQHETNRRTRQELSENPLDVLQRVRWGSADRKAVEALVPAHFSEREPQVDETYLQILLRYFRSPENVVAKKWLKGTELSEADLRVLGVPRSLSTSEDAMLGLRTLGCLARFYKPFFLCFDQIETLGVEEGGDAQTALFKFVTNLRTDIPRFLVLVSSLPETWQDIRGKLPASVVDRVQESVTTLVHPNAAQVRSVVRERLRRLTPEAAETWEAHAFAAPFFEELCSRSLTLRRSLEECDLRFARGLDPKGHPGAGAAPRSEEDLLAGLLGEAEAALPQEPDGLTLDEGALTNALQLALEGQVGEPGADGRRLQAVRRCKGKYPALELEVSTPAGTERWLLAFSSTENGNSFAAFVNAQVKRAGECGARRVLLLRPPGLEHIPDTWKASRKHLEELAPHGVELVPLDRASHLRLMAARKVVARADSQDITFGKDVVRRRTVEAFFRRRRVLAETAVIRLIIRLEAASAPAPASPAAAPPRPSAPPASPPATEPARAGAPAPTPAADTIEGVLLELLDLHRIVTVGKVVEHLLRVPAAAAPAPDALRARVQEAAERLQASGRLLLFRGEETTLCRAPDAARG